MTEGRSTVFDNAICISVTLKRFGLTRKVSTEVIDVDTDKKLLKLSKKILECPAIKEIDEIYAGIRNQLKTYGIVNALMKGGMFLIPFNFVERIEGYLREQQESLDYWKFQIGEQYDSAKEEFRSRLGELYREEDYPTAEALKAKFSIEYEFLAMDVPQALSYINQSIWQREQEKAQARVQVVSERVEQILVTHTQELIDHMIERLTDASDGKRKKFATNMLDKAQEFFETLRSRNLTGSEALNGLADRGQEVLRGIDLESLKDDASMRERIRSSFETIKTSMAGMIVAAPRRALNLQDDAEAVSQADQEDEVASVRPVEVVEEEQQQFVDIPF